MIVIALSISLIYSIEMEDDKPPMTPTIAQPMFPMPNVQVNTNSNAVMREDVACLNFMLYQLGLQWQQAAVMDSDQVCRLVSTTTKTLQTRREMLLMPIRPQQGKFSSEEDDYDTLDDI